MLLGKDNLNTIEVLTCKALIDSYSRNDEFLSINNMLRDTMELKKK